MSRSLRAQEAVQLLDPIPHVHRNAAHRLPLREDEILLHEVVQRGQLGLESDSSWRWRRRPYGCSGRASSSIRYWALWRRRGCGRLGGGLAGDGPVQFVLDRLEEADADVLRRVVVDAGGVDVGDLLVEAPLRGPDSLDPARQLLEVVETGWSRILQPLVVENEAFDEYSRRRWVAHIRNWVPRCDFTR